MSTTNTAATVRNAHAYGNSNSNSNSKSNNHGHGVAENVADIIQKLVLNPKYTKKKIYLPQQHSQQTTITTTKTTASDNFANDVDDDDDGNLSTTATTGRHHPPQFQDQQSQRRILSYSECGNIESGIPVLLCFGLMTSSIAVMFTHHRALRNNLHIIAVDYPGIGESTPVPDRTLAEWGDDMSYVCDTLFGPNSKIRLMGHSLGGLHVLALLSHAKFKQRVVRTVLLSPWMYLDGEEFNPMWMKLTRSLPTTIQSNVVPYLLTKYSTATINFAHAAATNAAAGSTATKTTTTGRTSQSKSTTTSSSSFQQQQQQQLYIHVTKLVTDYCLLQGPAGCYQMIQFALSKCETYLPHNLSSKSPIVVYHANKDHLVLESSTLELVRQLNERQCVATHVSIKDCDHNSMLTHPNCVAKALQSLVGDDDMMWTMEIINSLTSKTTIKDHNDDFDRSSGRRTRSMPNPRSRSHRRNTIKHDNNDDYENNDIRKSKSNHH